MSARLLVACVLAGFGAAAATPAVAPPSALLTPAALGIAHPGSHPGQAGSA
jgi:hypothetical protein